MACHGTADLFQPLLERQSFIQLGKFVSQVLHQGDHVGLAEQRRDLAPQNRLAPKSFDNQPKLRELHGPRQQPLGRSLLQTDHLGDQQELTRDAGFSHLLFHSLIHQPLMCGVLIHDDDAVLRLRDDVGGVELRARCTEREGDVRRSKRSCVLPVGNWLRDLFGARRGQDVQAGKRRIEGGSLRQALG